ncbi:MAG: DNA primase [Candidatus Melainabacteria bacterium]|nr:MAG: DNA primase [Candidatus Melainabacteria bacterium]
MAQTFEEALSQIKSQMDIVDIVSEEVVLKKKGSNYWGLCPFHGEKTPSFSVNAERGFFKCFGCGVGGDAITFLMKIHNWDYMQTIKYLAERYNVELPEYNGDGGKHKEERTLMTEACKKAVEFYQDILLSSPSDNIAVKYLNKRDITPAIISKFSLGLSLKEPNMLYNKLKRDYDDSILEKAGLILKSNQGRYVDRFRNRIIIPIQNEQGEYIAFGARAIEEGQNPKYLNSSDSPIYNKSRILYGLYTAKEAIKQEDSVVIMEGYFDVISAQAHGIHNAIASCGTSMTLEHVKMLSKYTRSRRIYLSFDTDLAGQNATKRGGELIKSAFSGLGNIKQFDESHISTNDDKYACEIRVVSPPEGKDPDEFIRSSGAEAFKSYIEHAPLLLDFELNQLLKKKNEVTTPQEKSELVKEILPVLNDVQNPIIQSEYVKIVATALSLDDKALQQDVKKVSRTDFIVPEVSSVNVTKSSPIEEIAQKNLLSLFLVNVSPYSTDMISGRIKSVNFTNKALIIVKDTIDKLINTVNNVSDLTNKLYTEFSQNQEIKSLITDLICISETFNNLKEAEFDTIIRENIETLEKCRLNEEHLQMKKLYQEANDDETESLKVQMQLRDKIKKLRTGDN